MKYRNIIKTNLSLTRNNLPNIKDGAYVINLYEYESIETHWIAYFCTGFIDFILKGKNLFEYTNLFSPCKYKGMLKYYNNIKIFSIESK